MATATKAQSQTASGPAAQVRQAKPALQAKLRIGEVNDVYEREADRLAETVMRMPEPSVQRKCSACEKEERSVQRKPSGPASAPDVAPPIVHDVLSSGGHPLDSSVRSFMEPRFGHSFADVRVHTEPRAAESARAVNAQAYAVGKHVVFGEGEYNPGTESGRRLLAHELVHTMQQGSGERTSSDVSLTGQVVARNPPPATPALPTVSLGNFRNSGNTSADNNCGICPKTLGVQAGDGTNIMELTGTITGHVATASYDIKRTKERGTWKKVGGTWTQLTHVGPGADDDSHDSDEDLTPSNDKIYVVDTPGFQSNTPVNDASATEAVYKASFNEFVNVRLGTGSWTKSSNDFAWHSISWFEKVGGNWQRKANASEIATGSTTVGSGDP